MNEKNIVTILLATFNRAHLIGETLDSILAQTYTNWECFIIDDNSTDTTETFLKENYLSKDSRFSYYKKPLHKYKKGLSDSRNYSLDLAKNANAAYIQFFDDDDIMHPQKLALQIKPFVDDVNLDMTLCKYRTFDENLDYDFNLERCEDYSTNIITHDLFWDFYSNKIDLNSLGPIWKFKIIKDEKFDIKLKTGEEKDFYLRIFLKKNIKYKPVNKILFWYRKHEKTVTKTVLITKKELDESLYYGAQKIRLLIIKSFKVTFKKKLKALYMLSICFFKHSFYGH